MRRKVLLQFLVVFGIIGIGLTQDQELSTFNNDSDLSNYTPGKFLHFSHGVESGQVHILNDRTILIEKLYYDGLAPDAHFWVGKGSRPNASGQVIPDENNNVKHQLNEYKGENVTLVLPDEVTVFDIDWLSIWCGDSSENFGHVMLNSKYESRPKHIQLPGNFNQTTDVSSGPILIISNKTFLITNFIFNKPSCDDAYFQGKLKTDNTVKFMDATGSVLPLRAYDGIDTFVRIPPKISLQEVDYLQVWCQTRSIALASIRLPTKLENVPEEAKMKDSPVIIRVPKCCPHNTVLMQHGCERSDVTMKLDIAVLEGNQTHVNDEKLQNVVFDYYIHQTPCPKYPVLPEEVEYAISTAGYLLMPQEPQPIKKDSYCFDSVEIDNPDGTEEVLFLSTVLMCFTNEETPEFAYIMYYTCISISAFFLFLTFAIFTYYSCNREFFSSTRFLSIICFTISLACSFTILAISQSLKPDGMLCDILGYFFQLFLISAFTWLTILCRETFYRIKHERSREVRSPKRIRKYIFIGILVPIGIFVLSFIVDKFALHHDPLKMKLGYSNCWFRSYGIVFYYYFPILIEIFLCFIYWYRTRSMIIELKNMSAADQTKFKLMNRSNFIVLSLMAVCWILEVVTYLMEISAVTMFISVMEALQGVFIFLIYVLHDPVKDIIVNDVKDKWFALKWCKKDDCSTAEGEEMRTLQQQQQGNVKVNGCV